MPARREPPGRGGTAAGRRAIRRAGLVALGALLALIAAELTVRLATAVSPRARLLATGPGGRPAREVASLETFARAWPIGPGPHRPWLGYWTNGLGFADEEPVEPKPPGRRRVVAVGDSYTFGTVPYPESAMTRLRAGLRRACPEQDLDLLNLGLIGASSRDYRALLALAVPRLAPDLVLVGFYGGNDGPDLYRVVHDRSWAERLLRRSYLWTLGKNVMKARRGVDDRRRAAAATRDTPAPGGSARGGAPVGGVPPIPRDDPSLVGPIMTEAAYRAGLTIELGRLYRPRDPTVLGSAWHPVLDDLDQIHTMVAAAGARLALALFPSVLQVDDGLRREVVERLRAEGRDLEAADIDPRLPGTVLAAWAQRRGITYLDSTPALVAAGGTAAARLYKVRDTHWTVEGNRVVAEAMVPALAALACS